MLILFCSLNYFTVSILVEGSLLGYIIFVQVKISALLKLWSDSCLLVLSKWQKTGELEHYLVYKVNRRMLCYKLI